MGGAPRDHAPKDIAECCHKCCQGIPCQIFSAEEKYSCRPHSQATIESCRDKAENYHLYGGAKKTCERLIEGQPVQEMRSGRCNWCRLIFLLTPTWQGLPISAVANCIRGSTQEKELKVVLI